MSQIALSAVCAILQPREPWRLTPIPEVTIRGALGRAILEIACTRPPPDCPSCPERGRCAIPSWYDPGRVGSQDIRPVQVEVLAEDRWVTPEQPLHLRLWVLGRRPWFSLLWSGIQEMARQGLGPMRVPHRILHLSVEGQGQTLWGFDDAHRATPGNLLQFVRLPPTVQGAHVHLHTPLCLKTMDRRRPPTPQTVLKTAVERIRRIARQQDVTLDRWWKSDIPARWETIRWVDASRWSQRQQATVDLSGWQGTMVLDDRVARVVDLLAAAERLQIGRNVSCGAGRLRITWKESAEPDVAAGQSPPSV